MSRTSITRFLLVVCLAALVSHIHGAPLPRSVSNSRQFIVYGPDPKLRGAICDLAERIKQSALVLLQESDRWRTPIVINAQYSQANLPELPPAYLNFSQTGFGLKIQLDFTIGSDVSAPAVERELLRAVFLEMMYRAEPDTPAGTPYVEPPDWLVAGTLALAPGGDISVLCASLDTAMLSSSVIPLDEFLRQRPALLDSPSRAVYRAYAAAFVSLLVETTDGRTRLAHFVADLPHATNDPLADLENHFPVLAGKAEKIQKTWTLGVARFAASERYRLLGCAETERQLAQLLRVELRDKDQALGVYPLEEFPKFLRKPGASESLNALTQQLLLLSGHAHPLYRPVIAEYEKIVKLLIRKKVKRVSQQLAEIRALREQITRRMSAIDDYMNWFEVTQSRNASGVFNSYLKVAEMAYEGRMKRHDRISVYLDSIESQF